MVAENKHYEIEFKADLYAFDIVSPIAQSKYGLQKKQVLPFVVILFDIMALINPNQGRKHPSPLSRISNIVQDVWGEKMAVEYLHTYESESSVNEFFEKLEN